LKNIALIALALSLLYRFWKKLVYFASSDESCVLFGRFGLELKKEKIFELAEIWFNKDTTEGGGPPTLSNVRGWRAVLISGLKSK